MDAFAALNQRDFDLPGLDVEAKLYPTVDGMEIAWTHAGRTVATARTSFDGEEIIWLDLDVVEDWQHRKVLTHIHVRLPRALRAAGFTHSVIPTTAADRDQLFTRYGYKREGSVLRASLAQQGSLVRIARSKL